jgi:hypothetical protein
MRHGRGRTLHISDTRVRSDHAPRLDELDLLRDLMKGGRHSRHTVVRCGVSLPTADRWLRALWIKIPGVSAIRVGKTTWFEWSPDRRDVPEWKEIAKAELLGPGGQPRAAPQRRRKPGRAVSS